MGCLLREMRPVRDVFFVGKFSPREGFGYGLFLSMGCFLVRCFLHEKFIGHSFLLREVLVVGSFSP